MCEKAQIRMKKWVNFWILIQKNVFSSTTLI